MVLCYVIPVEWIVCVLVVSPLPGAGKLQVYPIVHALLALRGGMPQIRIGNIHRFLYNVVQKKELIEYFWSFYSLWFLVRGCVGVCFDPLSFLF